MKFSHPRAITVSQCVNSDCSPEVSEAAASARDGNAPQFPRRIRPPFGPDSVGLRTRTPTGRVRIFVIAFMSCNGALPPSSSAAGDNSYRHFLRTRGLYPCDRARDGGFDQTSDPARDTCCQAAQQLTHRGAPTIVFLNYPKLGPRIAPMARYRDASKGYPNRGPADCPRRGTKPHETRCGLWRKASVPSGSHLAGKAPDDFLGVHTPNIQRCEERRHIAVDVAVADVPQLNRQVATEVTERADAHPCVRELTHTSACAFWAYHDCRPSLGDFAHVA